MQEITSQQLSTRQTYKKPISQLGIILLSVIERECKTARAQFYLNGSASGVKHEIIYLGVRDKKELLRVIDFYGFFGKGASITVKTIDAKEEENNFYLLTLSNNPI